jgi:hypothetical protein
MFSSSDGLLSSTSLSSEDRNDGAPAVDVVDAAFDLEADADAAADVDLPTSA